MRTMRIWLALGSATALAACGGGGGDGPQSVGSVATPAGPQSTHSFVNPTETKTYEGLGGVQHYEYGTRSDSSGQSGQLYAGDANTVRDSGISLTYNPRDAIYELTINRAAGIVNVSGFRFQDPAHRTAFGGALEPQAGVPEFAASKQIQYLETGSSSGSQLTGGVYATPAAAQSDYVVGANNFNSTAQTLFFQKPGTTTKYVTYAGYVRNTINASEQQDDPADPKHLEESYSFDRAVFAFGERTSNSAVPKSGTGTFSGDMIATMVFNPSLDSDPSSPTYFQWIDGSHTTSVDFSALTVKSDFTGKVLAPTLDAYTSGTFSMPANSTFSAHSNAVIDLVNKGGFTGAFTTATFTRPDSSTFTLVIAGSSIDGAFFGPNAQEIGGGFRIVGGTPDERIDILGAFTGK